MEKTSLKYLQAHTDIENVINKLNPKVLGQEQEKVLDYLFGTNKDFLPVWIFVEAVEQSPIAISITDKKANILYVNQSFTKITGYSLEEIVGKNESVLSYKATPRQVYYDLWHTISRNKQWQGELINKHKNGQPYLAELSIAPIQDSMRNTTHYIGMHRDITRQNSTEKKIINQKLMIESVINYSSVAMVVLDHNDQVILDNQQYKALVSDLNEKEPVRLFLKLLTQEIGDIRAYLEQKPNRLTNREIRIDTIHKHHPLWFSCSGNIFQEYTSDPENFFSKTCERYLVLSITNITRQRQQQEETYLQSLKLMLAEEEQIRSIRETLLGTIHQVSQPMNQIKAAIQVLQQKNQNGALMDLMQQLEESCQQTVNTLQRCVPEIAPTAITSININQILHEVLMLNNNRFLHNGITIDWNPSSILPNILGAENKLRMMFKQLIDNAINAVNQSKNTERNIKVSTLSKDKKVIITITDTGIGIPEQYKTKVFEPFFTTHRNGGVQAGMGLVMVQEIVHMFNGSIHIDPDYTLGCKLIVNFPVINQNDYNGYDQ